MLIDELFDQTDESITNGGDEKIDKDVYHGKKYQRDIFGRQNRLHLIIGLINQSVYNKMFDIAFEVTNRFMSDLLKAKYLPIFDSIFTQFMEDTTRYEAKLALMLNIIPLMTKQTAARFMKTIEGVLNEPASNSIFKNNLNPMRVGLMLYRVLEEVQ